LRWGLPFGEDLPVMRARDPAAHAGLALAAPGAIVLSGVVALSGTVAACGVSGAPAGEAPHASTLPAPAAPLRLATYNVQNLFGPAPDAGEPNRQEPTVRPSASDYATKLAGLASVIDRIAADVLVLQEVETRGVLGDLAEAVAPRLDYEFRYLYAGNDPRGIDLAVLSRVPAARIVRHDEEVFRVLTAACAAGSTGPDCEDYRYARDCLELHLLVRGQPLVLLAVHLKAREDETVADDAKRLAEAQHTRQIADRLRREDPERPVIVLGDFNAWPVTPERGALAGVAEHCACDGDLFVATTDTLPSEDAHTTFSSDLGHAAAYDDLLLSPEATARLLPGSVVVVHDDELEPAGRQASDHDPVAASLLVGRP
jgi:endonuclease/exonuclease/phosphatase family metal-dependent hydrolase